MILARLVLRNHKLTKAQDKPEKQDVKNQSDNKTDALSPEETS